MLPKTTVDQLAAAIAAAKEWREPVITPDIITAAARAAHEANLAYCLALGDLSQLPWGAAPEWQRASAIEGVHGVLGGDGPEQSHESWLAAKQRDGWVLGPVKDEIAKQHPCMLPYDELPAAQKAKDYLFVTVVGAMIEALSRGTEA